MDNTLQGLAGGQSTKSIEEYTARRAILDKKWDECTADEKLVKVREELGELGYNTTALRALEERVAQLELHTHAGDKIVVPLNSNKSSLNGAGAMRRNNLL